jgi:tRNA(fMet)-specific endonuclease VapC
MGVAIPTVGEMAAGIEMSNDPERHRKRVWRVLADLRKWPLDIAAAREFGRLRAALERIGRKMQQIDIQIAAIALTLGRTTVITNDSDLSAVPGLTVENWLETP